MPDAVSGAGDRSTNRTQQTVSSLRTEAKRRKQAHTITRENTKYKREIYGRHHETRREWDQPRRGIEDGLPEMTLLK